MKWALRTIKRAPINVEGIMMIKTAVRTSNKLSRMAGEHGPAERPDEEDVEASYSGDHSPQPVGSDRHQDGADHGEGRQQEHRDRHADDRPQGGVRHGVLDRDQDGDRQDHLADEGQRLLRVLTEELVVVPADKRQGHQHAGTPME